MQTVASCHRRPLTPVFGCARPQQHQRVLPRHDALPRAEAGQGQGPAEQQQPWGRTLLAAGVASLLVLGSGAPAGAIPPPAADQDCTVAALEKFADTRATFSLEASGGNMTEAIVDIRGCDFSNLDLRGKVLSGVFMQESNFSGSTLVGSQFARASAAGATMRGTDMTDANCFATSFDGADLQDAQFENAILSNASFGKYKGKWANLKGAHFEGALLSSSDVGRICENPTLDQFTRKAELGCRGPAPKAE